MKKKKNEKLITNEISWKQISGSNKNLSLQMADAYLAGNKI